MDSEYILRCFWFSEWELNQSGKYTTFHISEDHSLLPMFQRIGADLKQRFGWILSIDVEEIPGTKLWDMSPASPKTTKYTLICQL